MEKKTPQNRGRDFENEWAERLGTTPQRGSGNLWYAKMDVGDGTILWSCKHTDADSFRVNKELISEVQRAINGPGGIGGDAIPGAAIQAGGEAYVVLRADDFLRLAQEEVKHVRPSKAEEKRVRSRIPNLLREFEDDE